MDYSRIRPSALPSLSQCPGYVPSADDDDTLDAAAQRRNNASRFAGSAIHSSIHWAASQQRTPGAEEIRRHGIELGLVPHEADTAVQLFTWLMQWLPCGGVLSTEVTYPMPVGDGGDIGGTADVVHTHPIHGVRVADWKTGRRPVPPADRNLQVLHYAYLALTDMGADDDTSVVVAVNGPHCGLSEWATTAGGVLRRWRSAVHPVIVRSAMDDPPRFPGGACRYCRRASEMDCSAFVASYSDAASALAEWCPDDSVLRLISAASGGGRAEALGASVKLADWIAMAAAHVKRHVVASLADGEGIDGYTRRRAPSRTVIEDAEAVLEELVRLGIPERKLLSMFKPTIGGVSGLLDKQAAKQFWDDMKDRGAVVVQRSDGETVSRKRDNPLPGVSTPSRVQSMMDANDVSDFMEEMG